MVVKLKYGFIALKRYLKKGIRLGRFLVLMVLVLNLRGEVLAPEFEIDLALGSLTYGVRFNWWQWQSSAVLSEVSWWLQGRPVPEINLNPETEINQFVARQRRIRGLAYQISAEYARAPNLAMSPSAALKALEDTLAAEYEAQQAVTWQTERLLAEQVSQILRAEGFGVGDRLWPPLTFRFNEMPTYLIISERDHISQYRGRFLVPAMPAGERSALEARIEAELNVSALVDNVGGIGTWPTMVSDPLSIPSVIDTIAHEWNHNYMVFHPLGLNYNTNPDLRTINETVASIFGAEISEAVVKAYYPDLRQPPPPVTHNPVIDLFSRPIAGPKPEGYAEAMRRIRLRVDDYLAHNQIDAAEIYMEEERLKLAERGIYLRRLNQAFFAFHGTYAANPASVDPIGPWLKELRSQHPNLKSFIDQVAQFDDLADLLIAVDVSKQATKK